MQALVRGRAYHTVASAPTLAVTPSRSRGPRTNASGEGDGQEGREAGRWHRWTPAVAARVREVDRRQGLEHAAVGQGVERRARLDLHVEARPLLLDAHVNGATPGLAAMPEGLACRRVPIGHGRRLDAVSLGPRELHALG